MFQHSEEITAVAEKYPLSSFASYLWKSYRWIWLWIVALNLGSHF